MSYRLWVSKDRTVLVRLWLPDMTVEVATRPHPDAVWSPPVEVREEQA